ncbi:MAG: MGMT family protein [Candidatus Cloacimonetes bacterium]|nr:MGMT family protein [Candidatus Cloacimonadota bacterium]
MVSSFYIRAIEIIKKIPEGKVVTYGQIAKYAGNPRGSRQIARILHSSSEKHELLWHRVVNSKGKISFKPGCGFELQKSLLESEGVIFDKDKKINFVKYSWKPFD